MLKDKKLSVDQIVRAVDSLTPEEKHKFEDTMYKKKWKKWQKLIAEGRKLREANPDVTEQDVMNAIYMERYGRIPE